MHVGFKFDVHIDVNIHTYQTPFAKIIRNIMIILIVRIVELGPLAEKKRTISKGGALGRFTVKITGHVFDEQHIHTHRNTQTDNAHTFRAPSCLSSALYSSREQKITYREQ